MSNRSSKRLKTDSRSLLRIRHQTVKRNYPRPQDINQDIMLKCRTAEEAVRFFKKEHETYDMGFIELIGDVDHVFYIEVTPD